jgi:hypothetical protein
MDEKVIGILAAAAGVAPTLAAELATTDEGIAELQTKVTAKLASVKKDASGRGLKIATDALVAAGADPAVFEEGREFKENVAAAVQAVQAKPGSSKDLTDEQILKLPAVIKLKNELLLDTDRKVKAAETTAAEALKKDREDFHKEQTLVGVRAWADKQIDELKPIFSDNPAIAANQREMLRNQIVTAGTYQKEGDAYVLVDASGEIIKDAMQNALKPEAKARQLAESLFGLAVSDPKTSPGVKQGDVAADNKFVFQHFKGEVPKTAEEITALRADQSLPLDARKELKAYGETLGA